MKTPLDEFAKLLKNPSHNLLVDVYNGNKKMVRRLSVKKDESKYTLKQVGYKLDQVADALFEFIKSTNDNFKQVNSRIDNLEKDINTRLDYIVKANDLKDLPQK